jgi:hypothetical protein
MSVIGSNILAGASGQAGYNLTNSLRFRSSASAYLNRTPSTAGNRRTFTWSGWVKRGSLGASRRNMISAGTWSGGNLISAIAFDDGTADTLYVFCDIYGSGNQWQLRTTQVFRDPSAWYHIVVAVDTTQATSSNRVKIYVNGTQVTAFSTATYPSLNFDNPINNTVIHEIGASTAGEYFDGYQTEVNFIDGQALTPSSFGETSTSTGVWIPKKYTGTYGTNGFYLPFTDTTSTSTLGTDFSGNSNTWTVNNISLTSGSTYDSMTDVPTLTSATTANYATFNPVGIVYGGTYTGTCSNANLSFAQSGNASHGFGTMAVPSNASIGIYWEVVCTTMDAARTYIGMIDPYTTPAISANTASYGFPDKAILERNGNYFNLASGTAGGYSGSYTAYVVNDVIMVAYKNGVIWFGKNGTWMNSGNPAAGTGYIDNTIGTTNTWLPYVGYNSNFNINFGQQPFTYTAPTGFVALNTFNLPTPTIGATASSQANDYFDATLYTGNGSTQTITGVGFQPDFTWIKGRSVAADHYLADAVRGATKQLISNSTAAEATNNGLTAFTSNGFSVGAIGDTNTNAATFVAWNWKASNTTPVSNTQGSITSTVSANTTAGFSIVTYTGTGSVATIGHGLGVKPSMIFFKVRSNGTYGWYVYNSVINATNHLVLDTTAGSSSSSFLFNDTEPTSSVMTVGTSVGTNQSGQTFVAYCFAPIAGYSAFGSYTGNGSTDGTFVYTGFRPRWILIKVSSGGTGSWILYDTARNTYNVSQSILYPNLSDAEATTSSANLDILSNGFKLRTSNADFNGNTFTYIYMAFAENPFKYANAR